jgi:N-acetylglutamate synthase-like GNAT family acetyltransferase
MKEGISIRPYVDSDKQHVIELIRLNTPAFFATEEAEEFTYYLENELEHYFVVTKDNLIVGCGGYNLEDKQREGIISWDIVHPEFQGKTIGATLLSYRIAELKKIKSLQIIRVRTSQLVYGFYKKHGFRLVEVVEDYWSEGFDLYGLELPVKD